MTTFCSPPLSKKVEEIFSNYYYEKSHEMVNFIRIQSQEILGKIDLSDEFDAYRDMHTIITLVDSYYLDVIRYKEYHFDGLEDSNSDDWLQSIHLKKFISNNKSASLCSKWILKFQPIQIHTSDPDYQPTKDETKLILSVNSYLAISCSLAILKIDPRKNKNIQPLLDEIVYHMMYRQFDEKHFFLVYGQLSGEYG